MKKVVISEGILKTILFVFLSFCSAQAFIYDNILMISENNSVASGRGGALIWGIITVALFVFYTRGLECFLQDNKKKYALILGIVFSFFMIIGNCFVETQGLKVLGEEFGKYFVMLVGYTSFFTVALSMLFNSFEKKKSIKKSKTNRLIQFFNSHIFGCTFLILILCWTPFLIISFPGNLPYDPSGTIAGYLGEVPLTDQHPVFFTLVIGNLFKFGYWLISANFGIFLITFVQMLNFAIAISYMISFMKRMKICQGGLFVSIIFFALFYFWPAWSVYIVKDMLSVPFFIYFVICYVDLLFVKQYTNIKVRIVQLLLSGFIYSLFRLNGIHIVIISGLAAIFVIHKNLKNIFKILALIFIVYVLYLGVNFCVAEYLMPDNYTENTQLFKVGLSVPLQQTANYVKNFGYDVTEEEKEIISKVMNYDQISEIYIKDLSDPIWTSVNTTTNKEIIQYLGVWFKQFFRHPSAYFEATLGNNYRFFYFNLAYSAPFDVNFGIFEGYLAQNNFLQIAFPKGLEKQRELLGNYCTWQRKIPLLYLFSVCGTYTWGMLIIVFLLLRHHKYKEMVGLIPILLVICVCSVSPLNGNLPYLLPVMSVFPFSWSYLKYIISSS